MAASAWSFTSLRNQFREEVNCAAASQTGMTKLAVGTSMHCWDAIKEHIVSKNKLKTLFCSCGLALWIASILPDTCRCELKWWILAGEEGPSHSIDQVYKARCSISTPMQKPAKQAGMVFPFGRLAIGFGYGSFPPSSWGTNSLAGLQENVAKSPFAKRLLQGCKNSEEA